MMIVKELEIDVAKELMEPILMVQSNVKIMQKFFMDKLMYIWKLIHIGIANRLPIVIIVTIHNV